MVLLLGIALVPAPASAAPPSDGGPFTPGAAGIGDPYFPLEGNGGYNVRHYDLSIKYDPTSTVLSGIAKIQARATQNLSSFNLDFIGLTVRSLSVNGRPAGWTRDGGELTVVPQRGLPYGRMFSVVVRYFGVPATIATPGDMIGFIPTDDGALVIGQPDVAADWFPVNDHPSDKASYDIHITVPDGLETVSNGNLRSTTSKNGWTTWNWREGAPMASYLATATIGQFDLTTYRKNGLRVLDAIDPDLLTPYAGPHTGTQFMVSQAANTTYKRLAHTITVPADGADVSFWVTRDTEPNWDYLFVEAHTVGQDDWTTLPDLNGHTTTGTGRVCPFWLDLHPFLTHYQTDNGDGTCTPSGSTGSWAAATGGGTDAEQWHVDLSAFAGKTVELSLSYASDDLVQHAGVFIDDIAVSTGEGSTSFEDDGDTLDGWTVPGAPTGSIPNENDWRIGTAADLPPTVGQIAQGSFAREPEIIDFLAQNFGKYPFSTVGGVVDDVQGLGYALENQTRPIYARDFFTDPITGDGVVVHELAHQWYGDNVSVAKWKDIWLNEGFATYAEWLWSEHEGLGTAQQVFDAFYSGHPADDPFWTLPIGDPGPDNLFDGAVYDRGAMTLHQLRLKVGDTDFFHILKAWASWRGGRTGSTEQFIAAAERLSGQDLGAFFQTWLYEPVKPDLGNSPTARVTNTAAAVLMSALRPGVSAPRR